MNENKLNDEIDLREIVRTLTNGWLIILILASLGTGIGLGIAALQTPVFQSIANMNIDQKKLQLPISATDILTTDVCKQHVAETLGVSIDDLQDIPDRKQKINIIQNGNNVSISVENKDPLLAMNIANAWADAGIVTIFELVQNYYSQEKLAQENLDHAEKALTNYLKNNHLSVWTWTDLSILTGVGQEKTSTYKSEDKLPPISILQRLEISGLMREVIDATKYHDLTRYSLALVNFNFATSPPMILTKASVPDKPIFPKPLQTTMMGFSSGLLLGILWIFIAKWWQDSCINRK